MASRARKKKNKSPCSSRRSRCGLAALQRGHHDRHHLHRRYCCLFFGRSGLYPGGRARASGAAQEARYPAGTLGDIQAVTEYRTTPFKLNVSRLARVSESLVDAGRGPGV